MKIETTVDLSQVERRVVASLAEELREHAVDRYNDVIQEMLARRFERFFTEQTKAALVEHSWSEECMTLPKMEEALSGGYWRTELSGNPDAILGCPIHIVSHWPKREVGRAVRPLLGPRWWAWVLERLGICPVVMWLDDGPIMEDCPAMIMDNMVLCSPAQAAELRRWM